jgi:hypothetical protein
VRYPLREVGEVVTAAAAAASSQVQKDEDTQVDLENDRDEGYSNLMQREVVVEVNDG